MDVGTKARRGPLELSWACRAQAVSLALAQRGLRGSMCGRGEARRGDALPKPSLPVARGYPSLHQRPAMAYPRTPTLVVRTRQSKTPAPPPFRAAPPSRWPAGNSAVRKRRPKLKYSHQSSCAMSKYLGNEEERRKKITFCQIRGIYEEYCEVQGVPRKANCDVQHHLCARETGTVAFSFSSGYLCMLHPCLVFFFVRTVGCGSSSSGM